MKLVRYLTLILFLLLPFKISADTCGSNELARLRKLAGNVAADYHYGSFELVDEESGERDTSEGFIMNFTNLFEDLYVYDTTYGYRYYPNNAVAVANNYSDNNNYKFVVRSPRCGSKNLTTIYVKVPAQNIYYDQEICKGYNHLSVCQKWVSENRSAEEIQDYIDRYNEQRQKDNVEKPKVKGIFDYLFDFIVQYYYIVIPVVAVIGLLVVLILINKRKKDRLF